MKNRQTHSLTFHPGALKEGPGRWQFNRAAMEIWRHCEEKGWNEDVLIGEKLLLIVSEITEAFEHYRARPIDEVFYDESGKPDGFAIEIADALIRLLHLCSLIGIDIDSAVQEKMAYNVTREYRHGNKKA